MRGILLFGCGRMGGALLRGWIAGGFAGRIAVIDPYAQPVEGARMLAGAEEIASLEGPLTVVIATKPDKVRDALAALKPFHKPDTLVVSIAAGVTLASMTSVLGADAQVIRAMPNLPASIGQGITAAVASAGVDEATRAAGKQVLDAAGETVWVPEESMIDAVTAISGSGPAYFYRFTELLADAGRALGLPGDVAERLAQKTFTGAAALLASTGQTPEHLRKEVTSPNGTTYAALTTFDRDDRLGNLVGEAATSARDRSRELAG
jgi:pyrroline-5-carboxylate reductase